MNNTYKNFLKLSALFPDYQEAQIEDALMEYQETRDPMISNICVAFVYCKMFPYMLWKVRSFYYLTNEDKSSFCLEELTKMMRDFDPRKNATPYTLFDRYLMNRLRTETEALSYDKRKINNNVKNYDDILHVTYSENQYDQVEFLEALRSLDLNSNELRYCELIVKNANSIIDSDIALVLGISSAAVKYIKDNLHKKLTLSIL